MGSKSGSGSSDTSRELDEFPLKGSSTGSLVQNSQSGESEHKNGEVKGLSLGTTVVFIITSTLGSGLVALPNAMAHSGWTGLGLIILALLSTLYCSVLLGRCWTILQERQPGGARIRSRQAYLLIAGKAMGKPPGTFTAIMVGTCNLGACMVNVLMTGQILESLSTLGGFKMSQCYWFVIICVVLTPFTWLDTPKDFWFIGVLGTVSSVITAVFLVVGLTQALLDDGIPRRQAVTNPSARGLFLSLGTIVYGVGGTPTYPTLQHDMHAPEKFSRALVYGFIVITMIFLLVPLLAYVTFGHSLQANILLNLPEEGWVRLVAEVSLAVHLMTAALVYLNPVAQMTEGLLGLGEDFSWRNRLLRSSLFLIILFAIETVPRVEPIVGLFGGFSYTFAIFGAPVISYLRLCSQKGDWPDRSLPLHIKVLCIELICVGLFIACVATYAAVQEIISTQSKTFVPPCYINLIEGPPPGRRIP